MEMMLILCTFFAALAIFFIAQLLFDWQQRVEARRRLQQAALSTPKSKGLGPALGNFGQELVRQIDQKLPVKLKTDLQGLLNKAAWDWQPGKVVAVQIASGLGFLFAFGLLLDFDILALPIGLGGACLPLLSLHDAAGRRLKQIRKALPNAIDLLTTCVEAGLSFDLSLHRIFDRLPVGPLQHELGLTLSQMKLGQTRREALKALGQRIQLEEVQSFVSSLLQADQMGAPLGPALRAQSGQLHKLRSLRAQKAAAQAPIKMLFPLMFFILPVVFLVLFGPLFLKWSQGGF